MYEFYQWLIFESLIIAICILLYLFAAGKMHTRFTRTERFQNWKKYNGGTIRMMSILIIVVCIAVIIYKYYQIYDELHAPPSLNTD
ncbi:MAG: hypothetical protein R2794_04235 [Chitinophagales bacterium]